MTSTSTERSERPRAVLVAVQLPGVGDVDHAADLAELGRLVQTLGYDVVGTVSQRRDALAAAAVLGEGKLLELAALTGGKGIVPSGAPEVKTKARARWKAEAGAEAGEDDAGEDDDAGEAATEGMATVVVVDHEITPSQARNLEKATGAEVLDRTGVIVDIFHRHARSREARLQVEIARLNYVAPRMRESAGGKERQRGKGAGEAAIELDRRKIRDRVAELREELLAIQKQQDNRRYARRDQLRVALVGYTNAGKSSLMRAMTGIDVLVADKLFATLDTTIRPLYPDTRPKVLMSDTVGFIKKLPHDLVASFKSTLDEAASASLLLFVVDASDPSFRSQLDVTRTVLAEVGATDIPSLVVLNKQDRLGPDELAALQAEYPDAFFLSTRSKDDQQALRERIMRFFESDMVDEELHIPFTAQGVVAEIRAKVRILSEAYDAEGLTIRVRSTPENLAGIKKKLAR